MSCGLDALFALIEGGDWLFLTFVCEKNYYGLRAGS